MATAIENTIPCDRCNTSIDLRHWTDHIRNCVGNRNNRTTKEERRDYDDQPKNDRIRCDQCFAQIDRYEWKAHAKTCGEENIRRDPNLRDNAHDEPVEVTVPCEYCCAQINLHELERHTRECAENQRRQTKPPPPPKDESVLIPCEYCHQQIRTDEWERHMSQCFTGQRPDNKPIENDNVERVLIPCEYCNTPVAVNEWDRHTKKCAEKEKKRIAEIAKRVAKSKETPDVMLACDVCGQFFRMDKINAHEVKCGQQQTEAAIRPNTPIDQTPSVNFKFPELWDNSAPRNLTRYNLDPGSEEYRFVAEKFNKTLPKNQTVQIERIQNRRWYRQYDAHKDDFIERYNTSTEEWLFHGCRRAESAEAIIRDCFNRSHAVNCAVGQGIYFARHASISLGYTSPDGQGLRHMFMARVLVGKTTRGDRSTRVCPPGYDTTGGNDVFVTYHDAQAYAQYLIVFR